MASHNILKSEQGAVSLVFVLLILASVLVIVLSVASIKTKQVKFTQKTTAAISAKEAALTQKENILHDININSASIDDYYIAGGDPGSATDCEASPQPDWQSVSNYEYCLIYKGIFDDPSSYFLPKKIAVYEIRARIPYRDVVQRVSFYLNVGSEISEIQKLLASDAAGSDWFGQSVAISGNTIVVGSPRDAPIGSNGPGAAYVFEYISGSWTQIYKLTASDGLSGDYFGQSVAISGNTIVVGAHRRKEGSNSKVGAAYVFEKGVTDWGDPTTCGGDPYTCNENQKIMASIGAELDYFGQSVAISGNTIVAGAYGRDEGGDSNVGAAYVFKYNNPNWGIDCSGNVCNQNQKIMVSASDAAPNDTFGRSVAISGNTIVAGADGKDEGGSNAGAAYIFKYNNPNWGIDCSGNVCNQNQKIMVSASDANTTDLFGESVAISGNTIVVGARGEGWPGDKTGAAYIFEKGVTDWGDPTTCSGVSPDRVCNENQKIVASDKIDDGTFGESVAVSGNTIVVGAGEGFISPRLGSAYIFEYNNPNWGIDCSGNVCEENQKIMASDGADRDDFGESVAVSGNTIVVGARFKDWTFEAGAVYVFE